MTINTTSIRPDYLRDTRNIFALAAFLSFGFCMVGFIGEALQVVTYSLLPAAFCGVAGTLAGNRITEAHRIGYTHGETTAR